MDTEAPLAFYAQERKNGGNFDAGIRAAVARVLASPSFVYRSESDPATLQAAQWLVGRAAGHWQMEDVIASQG